MPKYVYAYKKSPPNGGLLFICNFWSLFDSGSDFVFGSGSDSGFDFCSGYSSVLPPSIAENRCYSLPLLSVFILCFKYDTCNQTTYNSGGNPTGSGF